VVEARDLAPGQQLVKCFKPFLRHLLSSNLSAKTLRKHRDNLWLLGGEIGIDSDAANRARLGPRAVTADRSLKALPINMIDVAAKRLLPLSLQACDRMHDAGAELATTAHVAHQAVSALTPTRASRRNPEPASTGHRRASMPEQHHTHRPAPGPGITP